MSRSLLVGEAPSEALHPWEVLGGRIGHRLSDLLGYDDWREVVDAVNLLSHRVGRDSKGDHAFPMREARAAAAVMVRCHPAFGHDARNPPILLGRRVAAAFRAVPAGYFELTTVRWFDEHGRLQVRFVRVFPHLSGRSRWWNDPANRALAAEEFAALGGLDKAQRKKSQEKPKGRVLRVGSAYT